MQKIPIDLAQPGMVLEKPITRDNGLVIAAQGTELTEGLINRLQNMEIGSVIVQGQPLELDQGGMGSFSTRAKRLDHLFRSHEGDEWMMKVKAFLRRYFLSRAAREQGSSGQGEGE